MVLDMKEMKSKIRICRWLIVLLLFSTGTISAQRIGVKTNLLYDATSTANLGVEASVGKQLTLDLSINYNGWLSTNKHSLKHWLIQPELRYWLDQKYYGHFWGVNAFYSDFNIGGFKLPFRLFDGLNNNRYRGNVVGTGLSYGYQWILGSRWGVELTAGFGYARISYKRFKCWHCTEKDTRSHGNYFGPTKAGVSIIYLIK